MIDIENDENNFSKKNQDLRVYYAAFAMIAIPGILYVLMTAPQIVVKIGWKYGFLFVYFWFSSMAFLYLCHATDPGVIPKNQKALLQKQLELKEKEKEKISYPPPIILEKVDDIFDKPPPYSAIQDEKKKQ